MKRGLYLICSLIFAAAITAGHAEDKKKKEAAKKKKPAAGKKKAETGIGNVPNPFLDMDVPGSILRLVDDCRELVEEIKDLESEGKEKDEIAKVKKELSEEKKESVESKSDKPAPNCNGKLMICRRSLIKPWIATIRMILINTANP